MEYNKKIIITAVLFFIFMLFVRFSTSAADGVYYSYDSGNIALAVQNYNISEERPHLPGYYLYVKVIRIVNLITHNTHFSILLLMSLFSVGGIALFFILANKFFSFKNAMYLTILLSANPLILFYGSVTEIYSFDLFFSTLVLLLGLNKKTIIYLPLAFALGAGFRLSSGIILLPLFVYFWYDYLRKTKNFKDLLIGNLFGLIALLIWLVPMVKSAGGLSGYLYLIETQNPVPAIGIARNLLQTLTMGIWGLLPLLILWFNSKLSKIKSNPDKKKIMIIILWLMPAVLIFTLVHYTRGYWLIAIGSIYLLTGFLLNTRKANILIIVFTVLQLVYFLFMPFKLFRPDIFYIPAQRSISDLEVIVDRFLSQNSLTLSHIKYIDKMQETIDSFIKNDTLNKNFLLDPTIIIYARALQASHQDNSFAELNLTRPDGFFLYKDLKQYNLAGRRELLDNSVIISIPSFIDILNRETVDILYQDEILVFFRVKQSKNEELRRIYNQYFQKQVF